MRLRARQMSDLRVRTCTSRTMNHESYNSRRNNRLIGRLSGAAYRLYLGTNFWFSLYFSFISFYFSPSRGAENSAT